MIEWIQLNPNSLILEGEAELMLMASSFERVLPIWRDHLWPGRLSKIEATSCLSPDGSIDLSFKQSPVDFWELNTEANIVATLSGFSTGVSDYRIRGLWVHPKYRGRGLSQSLLVAARLRAIELGKSSMWSLPRESALGAYRKFGFLQAGPFTSEKFEFGPNCLARYALV